MQCPMPEVPNPETRTCLFPPHELAVRADRRCEKAKEMRPDPPHSSLNQGPILQDAAQSLLGNVDGDLGSLLSLISYELQLLTLLITSCSSWPVASPKTSSSSPSVLPFVSGTKAQAHVSPRKHIIAKNT